MNDRGRYRAARSAKKTADLVCDGTPNVYDNGWHGIISYGNVWHRMAMYGNVWHGMVTHCDRREFSAYMTVWNIQYLKWSTLKGNNIEIMY